MFTARFANHDPAQQPRDPSTKHSSGHQEASPCSSRLAIPARVRMHLAHLVGALGLAHLVWRTWFGNLELATLDWQPWVGSLSRGDLGLAALRDGTLGHGTLGDGNQSLAFLDRSSCRDVVPSPHFDLAHCWLAHLGWRTQTWRSWMRRSSQGEWQC